MVQYANKKQAELGAIKDAICPHCFNKLTLPQIVPQQPDRYGRELRTYFGWCFECDLGCEVVQFVKDTPVGKRWLIHKYLHYKLITQTNYCLPIDQWVILFKLPEPAAVVTGPGGQYDKPIDPASVTGSEGQGNKQIDLASLEILTPVCLELQKVLKSLTQTVDCLLKAIR